MSKKEGLSENRKVGGISGSTTCVVFVLVLLCLFLLIFHGSNQASQYHEQYETAMGGYVTLLGELEDLESKSDTLENTVREYAATGDAAYMELYFEAYNSIDTGSTIMADVRRYASGSSLEIGALLTEALALVIDVREQEIHAMRLLTLAYGESEISEELKDYELSEDEQYETPDETIARAYEILYGEEYLAGKYSLSEKLEQIRELISESLDASGEEYSSDFSAAVGSQHTYLALLLLVFIALLGTVIGLLLVPIYLFFEDLKDGKVFRRTLTYEFNSFADLYNARYQSNETGRVELRKQADYDALTGLLNRGSFNKLTKKLKVSEEPIAMLWIDVDIFKSINDNYGHEMGDQALKRVASVLRETFRSKDYLIRYGGDEFLVLMMGILPSEKEVIRKKIDHINDVLLHPKDPSFPAYSVSVGIAFDKDGYSAELFRKADAALYYQKENGRCGYTFYQQDMSDSQNTGL